MTQEEFEDEKNLHYFEASLVSDQPFPAGFETWANKMTQYKYVMTLADKTVMDARLFIDHQGRFDNGSYTQHMLHKYNSL